jgi:hypothetical protein
LLGNVAQDQSNALGGKRLRYTPPNPRRGAGDQRSVALK